VVEKRPANPPEPPAWQSVLRRELIGTRLADVESMESRRLLLLHFTAEREGGLHVRTVVLEYGDTPSIALTTREGRVLAHSFPAREGLRHGALWTPPAESPVRDAPSRLASDFVHLRLCHGAEALFSAQEEERWLKAKVAPLEAKLKKLERTREKVLAEANRTAQAQTHQQEGELLAQNLARLTRGQREVVLPEYRTDGEVVQRLILLDPARTPKQEVEWRFHQYRRLLRGMDFATKRLAQLDLEESKLKAQRDRALAEPVDAPQASRKKNRQQDMAMAPMKSYQGHQDHPIWVGRGSVHNDALTFQVAKPWHVWFHVRGAPGAHVVVPIAKNGSLLPEVLLDAAHLALHHSDLKGEPRGEVSYVPIKRVRKAKDGPPGAVTFTGEKTIMLRVEPHRLERLLATETLAPNHSKSR
jgi:predicted ribosome quality control (RQC) complex YloA/Tae2 family protein